MKTRTSDRIHEYLVFVVGIVGRGLVVFWKIYAKLITKLLYNLFFIFNVQSFRGIVFLSGLLEDQTFWNDGFVLFILV